MVDNTNISGIFIILQPIIHIIIGFILGIFSTPLSNWVFCKDNEYCAFDSYISLQDRKEHKYPVRHTIIVTKQFGKTININCPYYKGKTKIKEHNGKKYRCCRYGESFDPKITEGGRCPFA